MDGLREEYKQRLDEKIKRDHVKALVKKHQDVEDRKAEQNNNAASWIQAHWLGLLERKNAEKARKKKRKGKKRKK